MAKTAVKTEPETQEPEVETPTEELETQESANENGDETNPDEVAAEAKEDETKVEDEEDEALEFVFGEEEPEKEEPNSVIKKLREQDKLKTKELRELRAKVAKEAEDKLPALGPKPTMADHDFDEDAFEVALDKWKETEVKHKAEAKAKQEKQAAEEARWKGQVNKHLERASELKVKDFADAELLVGEKLSTSQMGMIVDGAADNSAKLIYALAKNPSKLEDLAKQTHHVQFVRAVIALESTMKQTTKRSSVKPESQHNADGTISGSVQDQIDKAREKGDISTVMKLKRAARASTS